MQHTRGLLVTMLRMIKDLKVSIVIWDNGFCDIIKVPSLDTLIKVSAGRFCNLFSERSIRFILFILTKALRSMRISLLFLMFIFCKILRLLKQNFWSLVILLQVRFMERRLCQCLTVSQTSFNPVCMKTKFTMRVLFRKTRLSNCNPTIWYEM